MFSFLLRMFIIGMIIYLIMGFFLGWYARIVAVYWWMRPF
jgi:hypothetical protein